MAKKREPALGLAEAPDMGEDEVKNWQAVLTKTESWRKQQAEKGRWDVFVKEFKGDWSHIQANLDLVLMPINLVFAYVKTEIARLYVRDPWITVNPKKAEDIGAAKIAEQLVNYTWAQIDLKRQAKLALLDALVVGHGWIKLGYSASFGSIEDRPDKKDEKKEHDVEPSEFIKSENVFAYHVPWKDILFDPSAKRPPYDCRWIAHKVVKPLRAVKDSGIYTNTEGLKPSDASREGSAPGQQGGDVSSVTLWEIWDLEHRRCLTLSPGHDKQLRKDTKWPYKMDGYPFGMLSFNTVPGEPYPISDIAPWEAITIELTKLMAIMQNHLKRWNRQIFIKRGLMTDEERAKFKNGTDGQIIQVDGDPNKEFFIPPYAAVQQDIYGVWNLLMDMWRNVSGQSETERGAPAKSNTRTLGELRLQIQGGKSRSDEKLDVFEDFLSEVARKLLSLMQQFMSLPKVVRIVGQKAIDEATLKARPSAKMDQSVTTPFSFSATSEDIHGEMDVDTLAGSTVPLTKEHKLEIYEKFAQGMQAFGIMPGSKAAREFGREILREVDIKSLERIMDIADQEHAQAQQNPTPNPEAMKAQAQMQLMQQKGQMEAQKGQMEMQIMQQQAQMEAQMEQLKIQLEQQKAQLQIALLEAKARATQHQGEVQAATTEHKAQVEHATTDMRLRENVLTHLLKASSVAKKAAETNGGK